MQSPQNLSLKITNIPYEVLYEILAKTSPKDINNYCSTSLASSGVCKDQSFWKMKLWADFSKMEKVEGMSWEKMYQMMFTSINNSKISAGKYHYSLIDEQGNLYIAGMVTDFVQENPHRVTTISNKLTKIEMGSKVISASMGVNMIAILTEKDETHIFFFELISSFQMRTELWKITKTENPIAVVILPDVDSIREDNAGTITDDGYIYLDYYKYNGYVKPDNPNEKFVDVAMLDGEIYVLSSTGTVMRVFFNNWQDLDKSHIKITYSKIELPEPIKKISGTSNSLAALSKNGNVYVIGRILNGANISEHTKTKTHITISSPIDIKRVQMEQRQSGNTPRYYYTTLENPNVLYPAKHIREYEYEAQLPQYFYKINLPQPIMSIDTSKNTLVALTIYGKMILLRDGKISNIDIGQSVGYIAAGGNFMIAIAMDSKLNHFLYSSIIDSAKG